MKNPQFNIGLQNNEEERFLQRHPIASTKRLEEHLADKFGMFITQNQRVWLYKTQVTGEREILSIQTTSVGFTTGNLLVRMSCSRMSAYYGSPAIVKVTLTPEGHLEHWGVYINEREQVYFSHSVEWSTNSKDWKAYRYLSADCGTVSRRDIGRCKEGRPFPPLDESVVARGIPLDKTPLATKRNHLLATFIANRTRKDSFTLPLDTPLAFDEALYADELTKSMLWADYDHQPSD